MKFYTKAQTLINLKRLGINVPKLKIYKVRNYNKNKNKILDDIVKTFKGKIALRSSSIKEDALKKSNAGKYKSFLNIDSNNDEQIRDKISEIIKDFDINYKNQFFVQDMVQNVKMSGVCTTRDLQSKLPYFVINYSKSKDTTLVTSGKINTDTFNFIENKFYDITNKNFKKIIIISKKLIKIFKNDSLDIEFAINKNNKLFILQVRPIYIKSKSSLISKEYLNNILIKLKKKIKKLKNKHYDLIGDTTYFGVMPDWNPAEIIGLKPKPLALTLYREIITDHVWSSNRKNIGFKDLSSHHLMTTFFGTPYIDVRIDFNSWIPSLLSPNLSKKLIRYYLAKFKKNKDFHDKVEFEILFTCYTLSTKKRIFNDLKNKFTKKEIIEIIKNLRIINSRSINEYIKNSDSIKKLIIKQKQINNLDIHQINKIYFLIEDCKKYGTYAFSGIARCAFIAVEMLNSFVDEKIITEEEKSKFLNSIKTINKEMQIDINLISKKKFINKYGHLRPNTYEINNLNYKDGYNLYFQKVRKNKKNFKTKIFKFTNVQMRKINKKLKENRLNINSVKLLKFIKDSIELREYSKFVFSKSIDMIFENLQEFGKKYNITKENLSYLNLDTITNLHYNLDLSDTTKILKREILENKKKYDLNVRIPLPEVITDEKSIYIFNTVQTKINFITNKIVAGKINVFNKKLNFYNMKNKILCIENADPGYDFIFNFEIKGLVTRFGGANSHMAIRCAELNIPAMIGVGEKNYESIINSSFVKIDPQLKKFDLI